MPFHIVGRQARVRGNIAGWYCYALRYSPKVLGSTCPPVQPIDVPKAQRAEAKTGRQHTVEGQITSPNRRSMPLVNGTHTSDVGAVALLKFRCNLRGVVCNIVLIIL